ncbi:unnamed protein product [Larinioides sclopetarius]|uniref:TGF-beta family profile domain-containing protein n=1 Tax=Larinioides sclopetarius TaxID=280406 RepID=A0AAV2BR96_9ARAC
MAHASPSASFHRWRAWWSLSERSHAVALRGDARELVGSGGNPRERDGGLARTRGPAGGGFVPASCVGQPRDEATAGHAASEHHTGRTAKDDQEISEEYCERDSYVEFHPEIEYDSRVLWARLRFPNSSTSDVSDVLRKWRRDGEELLLTLPCLRCCGARLEILVRESTSGARSKRSACGRECCRRPLRIRFKDIGWDWIVQPAEFEAFYCKGRCRDSTDDFASTHALMQSILSFKGRKVSRPCCAPRKLRPLNLLHYNDKQPPELVVTRQKGMIVKECACT